jgi:hypothetical protein
MANTARATCEYSTDRVIAQPRPIRFGCARFCRSEESGAGPPEVLIAQPEPVHRVRHCPIVSVRDRERHQSGQRKPGRRDDEQDEHRQHGTELAHRAAYREAGIVDACMAT